MLGVGGQALLSRQLGLYFPFFLLIWEVYFWATLQAKGCHPFLYKIVFTPSSGLNAMWAKLPPNVVSQIHSHDLDVSYVFTPLITCASPYPYSLSGHRTHFNASCKRGVPRLRGSVLLQHRLPPCPSVTQTHIT